MSAGFIHPQGEHPGDTGDLGYDIIAMIVHEANRAYCAAIGDNSQLPWSEAPEWQRNSAIEGIIKVHGDATMTPERTHQSWMDAKLRDGWRFGLVKDAEAKTHPCIIPYSELPESQKVKDRLFLAIVNALL